MIVLIKNLIPFNIKSLKKSSKNNKIKYHDNIIGKILELKVNTKIGNVDARCYIYKKYEKLIKGVKHA